jgi:putative membrane protein
MRTIALTALLTTAAAGAALAHGGEVHGTEATWTFDPWIVGPLLAIGMPYLFGAWMLGRRTTIGYRARMWSAAAFGLGWLSLAGALVSPLHWLGEHLFTFHMIEHEIVMAVSAPLLIAARPIGTMLWALPRRARLMAGRLLRRRGIVTAWDWLSSGGNATVLHGIAIWAWHAPVLFDAAVTNVAMHRLQHLSFLLTAMLFWWSVLYRSHPGVAAWHLFVTMIHTSILGALMALAPKVLYQAQTATALEWGLTPLQDQQLAGLIMWIPAGTVYAGAAMALTVIWIRKSGETRRRSDAVGAV